MSSRAQLGGLRNLAHREGYCFTASLPEQAGNGDDPDHSFRSSLRLFEEGREVGPAHALHADIAAHGGGRYSHWGDTLFFSASDDSDPRTNGRSYQVLFHPGNDDRTAVLHSALGVDFDALGGEARYLWGERLFSVAVPATPLSEYGRSFLNDAPFREDYERFERQNYRSFDRKFALKELFKLALPLSGDVAECGVFRGASAFLLAKMMAADAPTKTLHLFDSFEGISAPVRGIDGDYWAKGALACDIKTVASNLQDQSERIKLYRGWIPERFVEVHQTSFCFLHLDVDLYEPTRDALGFFGPRLTSGGLIVCDDYGFETCPGARLAMDQYAATVGVPVVHLPTGQGVIFSR